MLPVSLEAFAAAAAAAAADLRWRETAREAPPLSGQQKSEGFPGPGWTTWQCPRTPDFLP